MLQQRRKKGFTLAELLIVVAIIAVLTAIAVPLFVTGLQKAQDATFAANQRAVRGAAVVGILSATKGSAWDPDTLFTDSNNDVYATATIDDGGNISGLTITKDTTEVTANYKAWKDADGEITVKVSKTDLKP